MRARPRGRCEDAKTADGDEITQNANHNAEDEVTACTRGGPLIKQCPITAPDPRLSRHTMTEVNGQFKARRKKDCSSRCMACEENNKKTIRFQ